MLTIPAITFRFFALVLCGYLAVRRKLPLAAIGGLHSFVLYFALPCMVLVACLASDSNVSLLSFFDVFGGRQMAGVTLAAISAPSACAAPG